MKRRIALIAALIMLLGAWALAEPATLTVHGTGIVSMAPDQASIGFGVSRSSKDIAEAQTYVNDTLGRIIEELKGMGVQEKDIQTNAINIYRDYDYEPSTPGDIAYVVENSVTLMISDIDHAGQYIDAVFEAGANTFSGISFGASDSSAEKTRALELAVADARGKAETLAEAAGMRLGAIRSMNDSVGDSGYYGDMSNGLYAAKEAASDSFANLVFAADLQVSASVTVVYELSPVE
jgi:hypothetical protein